MSTYTDILPWLILAFIIGDFSVSSWFLYSKEVGRDHRAGRSGLPLSPRRATARGVTALFTVACAVLLLRGTLIPWNTVVPVALWWVVCALIFLYSSLTALVIISSLFGSGSRSTRAQG